VKPKFKPKASKYHINLYINTLREIIIYKKNRDKNTKDLEKELREVKDYYKIN